MARHLRRSHNPFTNQVYFHSGPGKALCGAALRRIFANLRDLGGIRRPFMTYDHKHEALS